MDGQRENSIPSLTHKQSLRGCNNYNDNNNNPFATIIFVGLLS